MKCNEMARALVIHTMRDLIPEWSFRGIEAKWDDDTALRLLDSLNTYFEIETNSAPIVVGRPIAEITPPPNETRGRGAKVAQTLLNYINLHLQPGANFIDLRPSFFNWDMESLRVRAGHLNRSSFKQRYYPHLHIKTTKFRDFVRVYVSKKGAN